MDELLRGLEIFGGGVCLFLGAAFFRMFVDFREATGLASRGNRMGYGLEGWYNARASNCNPERPSHSIGEGLASVTRDGKVYLKFESAPTKEGLF